MSNYEDLMAELEKNSNEKSSHETDQKLKEQPESQEKGTTEQKDGTDNTGPAAVDDEVSPGEANQATDTAGVDSEEPSTTGNPSAEVPESKSHPTSQELADKNANRADAMKEAISKIQSNMEMALEHEKETSKEAAETSEESPEDVKAKQVDEEGETEPKNKPKEPKDPIDEILEESDTDEDEEEDGEEDEDEDDSEEEKLSMKEAGYVTADLVANDLITKQAQEKQAQAEQWVNSVIEKAAQDANAVCDFYDTVAKQAQGEMMGAMPPGATEALQGGAVPTPAPEGPGNLPEGAMTEAELLTTLEMLANGQEPSNDMEAKLKQIMVDAGVIDESSNESPSEPSEETTPKEVAEDAAEESGGNNDKKKEENNDDEEAMKAAALDDLSPEDLKSLRNVVELLNQEGN